jgi:hypothetical protein
MDAADKMQTSVNLNEIEEIEALEKFNPLSLPRLYVNEELIASQNPPKVESVREALVRVSENH